VAEEDDEPLERRPAVFPAKLNHPARPAIPAKTMPVHFSTHQKKQKGIQPDTSFIAARISFQCCAGHVTDRGPGQATYTATAAVSLCTFVVRADWSRTISSKARGNVSLRGGKRGVRNARNVSLQA
jgi:hypothetical protein